MTGSIKLKCRTDLLPGISGLSRQVVSHGSGLVVVVSQERFHCAVKQHSDYTEWGPYTKVISSCRIHGIFMIISNICHWYLQEVLSSSLFLYTRVPLQRDTVQR